MADQKPTKVASQDRSMDTERADRSTVFFFPKHTPPTSVRAKTREEAEALLETSNKKDRG